MAAMMGRLLCLCMAFAWTIASGNSASGAALQLLPGDTDRKSVV